MKHCNCDVVLCRKPFHPNTFSEPLSASILGIIAADKTPF